MQRLLSTQLSEHIGEKVLVRGWLNNVRELGKITFLVLRDRKGLTQIVIEDKAEFEKIKPLQPGSVLKIEAEVQETDKTDLGIELISPAIEVESPVTDVPPIEYNKPKLNADLDTILDHRPISLRNRQIQAVFKVQAEIMVAYRDYMRNEVEALEYFGPNIIGASSEGGAELFTVDYFNHKATLAQCSQLYKQIMVGVAERTFALMPFYRAENSNTVRHLTEGKQLEFEMGFFETWHEVIDVFEGAVKHIVSHVRNTCATEIDLLGNSLIQVPEDVECPRLTFEEAQQLYFERTGIDERSEDDLSPAAEKELCAWSREKHGTDLVFIIDWKTSKRPFYSYVNDENPELTNTFDALLNGTEVTSGGQRCHTHQSLVEGLERKEMNPEEFEDYLSIFKYGMPPHGGFGLGLERLTMTLLDLPNIRQATLFPSDPKRIASQRIKANIVTGGENIRNEIVKALKAANIEFQHDKHEPTPTSEDSARVRGTKLEEGIKALILKGKSSKENYQFNIPSHLKIDMKKVKEIVGEACEFESPETIEKRYGIIIGGVPPFGHLLGIKTYMDSRIAHEDKAAFNCGLREESVTMQSKDLLDIVDAEIADFSKE